MASIIRIKRSGITAVPEDLAAGELAYSWASAAGGKLYIGSGVETTPGVAPNVVAVGGVYYTDLVTDRLSHTPGTLTANSAIIVNGDKKIDNIKVGNLDLITNTISGTGTIFLAPGGAGTIDVSSSKITSLAYPTVDTDAASKLYVDTVVGALGDAANLDIASDSGDIEIILSSEILTIAGGTGLSSSGTGNTITIKLDDTAVTLGTYGSSTAIPVLTINAQGQITSATTENIATTLSVATDNAGTGSIDLLEDTLTVSGGTGLTSSISGNAITIDLDDTAVTIGSYGSADTVSTFTVDAQGRLTAAGETTIDIVSTQINDFVNAVRDVVGDPGFISGSSTQGITVTYTTEGRTLDITAENATDGQKGVASFNIDDFDVTDGDVELKDTVVKSITTDSGALTPSVHSISILGGTAIGVTHLAGGSTITVAADIATTTDVGVASFNTSEFTVSGTGEVAINSGGIANSKLANSSITIGTTAINLGSDSTTLAGLTQVDIGTVQIATNTITTTGTATDLNLSPVSGGDVNLTATGTGDINLTVASGREITASTLAVSDLTSGRVVYASTNGSLVDSANLTFNGADLTVSGQVNGGNLRLAGNTLSSTDEDGNIVLAPNGTGVIDASSTKIINLGTPTVGTDAATKTYVDTIASSAIHYHLPVRVEAPTALNAGYDNGTDGVGATLTNAGTQAALIIDGITLVVDDRVLVYNQEDLPVTGSATHNGIYVVSNVGSASTNWVLTRATDTDTYAPSSPDALGTGDAFFVKEGITGAGELYVMNTPGPITLGTTGLNFVQISSAQIYKAGAALELDQLDSVKFNVLVDGTSIEINGSNQLQLAAGGITNSMLADNSIENIKLANSSITFAGESGTPEAISLGQTITFAAGEGINTVVDGANNTITISGEDATDENKGIASFDATDFTVAAGNVTINTERVQDMIFSVISATANTGISVAYNDDPENTFTIAGIDASTTVKGVAKFNGLTDTGGVNQFSVTNGEVTIVALDGGTF